MAGIYVHIPFCAKRCHYCDFFSSTTTRFIEPMVEAIIKEIKRNINTLPEPVETIYFGGGTPSFIPAKEIHSILQNITEQFDITSTPEITLEANPDDLDRNKIQDIKNMGINRLSIGVQSFHDDELEMMNRRHRAGEALAAVKESQDAGFENISIDLIYGLPGQDLQKFDFSIQKALSLEVPHISAYHLSYEPGTVFYELLRKKQIEAVSEDISVSLFSHLIDQFTNEGYIHYEISNFARPGQFSKHNTNYWKNKPYLGLGPSAHSYDGHKRKWNVSHMIQYINGLNKGNPVFEEEALSEVQKLNEYIMVSLRTIWGSDLNYLEDHFDRNLLEKLQTSIEEYISKGLLERKNNALVLSRKGIFIADAILADLFID